jgi:hypothetical protein
MKNLIQMLDTHSARAFSNDIHFKPNNRLKGLCAYCEEPIAGYGRNKINCEYHWLKHKYYSIKSNCENANSTKAKDKNSHLQGIFCKMSWQSFIVWSHEHDDYKRLKDPALLRVDKDKDFELSNIRWGEMKEVFNSAYRKS